MALSPKKRFSVLERDWFTCKYCWWKPPFVQLEVDHVIPKCKWGKDTDENLVSSCSVCNSGKGKNIVWEPDWNSWKTKLNDYIYEEKMKFYNEWNLNKLWIISEKTKTLISIYFADMFKWSDWKAYQGYLTLCKKWKLEDLEKQFLLWWKFFEKVLNQTKIMQEEFLIETITEDSGWQWDSNPDKRLNYLLTRLLSNKLQKTYVLKKYTLFPNLLEQWATKSF